MRRPIDAAEPVRFVLLGLLLDGPSHGYDLARAFAPGTVFGSVVHLGASHLYALLARLERDGLAAGEQKVQGIRPPRRVFQITDAGRDALQSWLDEPVARPRDFLLDFPLKLYLAHRRDPEQAHELVARQRAVFVTYLADLEREPQPDGPPLDRSFLCLLHEARVERTRSALIWLGRCAEVLSTTTQEAPR